jgi:putative phosphoribosyl transferase
MLSRTIEIGPSHISGRYEGDPDADRVVILAASQGSGTDDGAMAHEADLLHRRGLATLRLDLLREPEQRNRRTLYDIDLLAGRVADGIAWVQAQPRRRHAQIGLSGCGTIAAALLRAASQAPGEVSAVVSRSGRPDLAAHSLAGVDASTLLIVGGLDPLTRGLNRGALGRLGARGKLAVVPGASHGFGEAGLLHHATLLATHWLDHHLARSDSARGEPAAPAPALSPLKPQPAAPSTMSPVDGHWRWGAMS